MRPVCLCKALFSDLHKKRPSLGHGCSLVTGALGKWSTLRNQPTMANGP